MATATEKKKHTRATPQTTKSSAWAALGVHTITLPSSAVVKIRIPDLAMLLAGDAVPERLRTVAFDEVRKSIAESAAARGPLAAVDGASDEVNTERLRGLADLNRFMISKTLVEPAMTEDELRSTQVPAEDLMMLTQIAARERTVDAVGVTIGVEALDRWDLWRQAHECDTDCEACTEVQAALSSTDFA